MGGNLNKRFLLVGAAEEDSYYFRLQVAQAFAVHDEPRLPSMIREYQMVTNKCGIIDLTWKGKIEVCFGSFINFNVSPGEQDD